MGCGHSTTTSGEGEQLVGSPTPAPKGEEAAVTVDDEGIVQERRSTFGEKLRRPSVTIEKRADNVMMGVLPLAAAFDRYDVDNSAGLSTTEVPTTSQTHDRNTFLHPPLLCWIDPRMHS